MQQGKQFVYVDESGFEAYAARRYGYAPVGERIFGLRPGKRTPRTSLIAAWIDQRLQCSGLYTQTCNTALFNTWLSMQLCPKLTANHVVIMDNATFHKSLKTQSLIQKTGATLLYLPPYSPDFNPIEKQFATLKKYREYHPNLSLVELINMFDSS